MERRGNIFQLVVETYLPKFMKPRPRCSTMSLGPGDVWSSRDGQGSCRAEVTFCAGRQEASLQTRNKYRPPVAHGPHCTPSAALACSALHPPLVAQS